MPVLTSEFLSWPLNNVSVHYEFTNTFLTGVFWCGVFRDGLQCQEMHACPGICLVVISVQKKYSCHLECWEVSLAPDKLITRVRISQDSNYINAHAGIRVFLEKEQNKGKRNLKHVIKKNNNSFSYGLFLLFLDVASHWVLTNAAKILHIPGLLLRLDIRSFKKSWMNLSKALHFSCSSPVMSIWCYLLSNIQLVQPKSSVVWFTHMPKYWASLTGMLWLPCSTEEAQYFPTQQFCQSLSKYLALSDQGRCKSNSKGGADLLLPPNRPTKCAHGVFAFLTAKLGGDKGFGILHTHWCTLILLSRSELCCSSTSLMCQHTLLQDHKEFDTWWGMPVSIFLYKNTHVPYAMGSGVPPSTNWFYGSDWTVKFLEIIEESSELVAILWAEQSSRTLSKSYFHI